MKDAVGILTIHRKNWNCITNEDGERSSFPGQGNGNLNHFDYDTVLINEHIGSDALQQHVKNLNNNTITVFRNLLV